MSQRKHETPDGLSQRLLSWIDAVMASLGDGFLRAWTKVERAYRRPFAHLASRLKFAFFPLLALGAIAWLGWDWRHGQSLNAAENAIFDQVVTWRPFEPRPSGRVVVVEIDDCSIDYFTRRGEGGWPWSRQRHADLLDRLDRAGVRAVGYDVLFADASREDALGDETLEAMAEGGAGRFVFGASRMHPDFDGRSPLLASQAPSAFPRVRHPVDDPKVALLLPYGPAMARHSAITNITRNEDGVLRDIPLQVIAGDWALPALPLRLAMDAGKRPKRDVAASVRPNWRQDSRLPHVSAADVLTGDTPICRDLTTPVPALKGHVVLVGYTASGLNDAKPTPVDPVMPGVEVLAEATEALIANSAIRSPPVGLKYAMAALLVLLTTFAFFRGEPANDIDSIFVATNLALLTASFVGLTFFGFFFDIFSSVAFVSLIFGLCRLYAGAQRGRAVGNGDFLPEFDPRTDRWLALARLRFVPDAGLDGKSASRRRREYHRRLRRFLYAGSDAVMLEGVVERKSWLHATLDDLMVLVWHGSDATAVRDAALRDLARLERQLAEHDARLPDDGCVRVAFACAQIDDGSEDSGADRAARLRLRELLGRVLLSSDEQPLGRRDAFIVPAVATPGGV
jgi:CHASE2 domain-containing sensor protein